MAEGDPNPNPNPNPGTETNPELELKKPTTQPLTQTPSFGYLSTTYTSYLCLGGRLGEERRPAPLTSLAATLD